MQIGIIHIEYSTCTKFQIFIVVAGWVFTENTQELIIIFSLRLKDFIREFNTNNKNKKQNITYKKQLQSITKTQVKESYLIVNLAMLITMSLLLDDIKESNLYEVGHDMFLKYFFLISLYFGQHNKTWNSDSVTF